MTKIISFSGRRQSGKNSCSNYVLGHQLLINGYCNKYRLDDNGQLIVNGKLFDDKDYPDFTESIKLYSFADVLKKDVCIKILGLSHEQCFGTDDQKNSLTKLRWENMPGIISFDDFKNYSGYETSSGFGITTEVEFDSTAPLSKNGYEHNWCGYVDEKIETDPSLFNGKKWIGGLIIHEPGFMTGREVMQYVGSDIFRRMYSDVWIDATYRQIYLDSPNLAIITDCRFPEEVFKGNSNGNVVVRLTRVPFPNDTHKSEKVLDRENFDWSNFNMVLDNSNMNINEQGEASVRYLKSLGYIC